MVRGLKTPHKYECKKAGPTDLHCRGTAKTTRPGSGQKGLCHWSSVGVLGRERTQQAYAFGCFAKDSIKWTTHLAVPPPDIIRVSTQDGERTRARRRQQGPLESISSVLILKLAQT